MLIWLKSSSLVFVVIGSMPMPICNRFHERQANNVKIGVPLFYAVVRRFLWTSKIETWTVEIYVQCWKFHTQLLHVYLNWFWLILLLKCVCSLKSPKNQLKNLFWRSRLSKVIEFGGNREPVYDFLLVIYRPYLVSLGPVLHHYWDTATYWLKITNFLYPSFI